MLSLSLAEIYALDSVSRADLGACIAAHALGVVDFGEIVLDLNCASWAGILALLAAYAGSLARLYGYRALVLAAACDYCLCVSRNKPDYKARTCPCAHSAAGANGARCLACYNFAIIGGKPPYMRAGIIDP